MTKVYKVSSPLKIYWGKRVLKPFYLNLNIYRNFNKFALGTIKKNYFEIMKPQLKPLPKFKAVSLRYVLYTGSRKKVDIMNFGSIVDKFFCDCLTGTGKIEDDNYDYVKEISFEYGGVCKSNPRVDIFITEIGNKK